MASARADVGSWEWLRAHRVGLGPFYILPPLLALGGVLHVLDSGPALLTIGAFAIAVLFWAHEAQGWRRPYFVGVGLTAVAWLLWAHLASGTFRSWVWLTTALAFATILLAIPWWSDHVRRSHVKMEMVVRDWPIRAARIGLNKTALTNVVASSIGWTGRLSWQPGEYSVDRVAGMRTELEGALGLGVGQLRVPANGKSTNSVNLIAIVHDPHSAAISWEIPHVVAPDGQLVVKQGSIADAIAIGLREDGSEKRINLWTARGGRHVLVGGMTGSGKSGLLNLLWGSLALCRDVVQWGIDLKGGVELGPWQACFDWVVKTRAGAVTMLEALNAEMERRYKLLGESSSNGGKVQRVWKPTAQDPVIVLSVDEAASLLGNATMAELNLVEEIARKGRAAGIILILATQFPTVDAIGTTQIREQMHFSFCFRMHSSKGENFVITADSSIDAHKIDENRPGTCYTQDGATLDKMPCRCFFLDDETVEQMAVLAAGLAPRLVAEVEAFLVSVAPEYAERDATTRRDDETEGETGETEDETIPPWREDDDETMDDITTRRDETLSETDRAALDADRAKREEEPVRLGEQEAREALAAALESAGIAGAKVPDLTKRATRSSSWVYERLNEWEVEEKVKRSPSGTWVWTPKFWTLDHAA